MPTNINDDPFQRRFIVYKLPRSRGNNNPLLDRGAAFSYFDSENAHAGWDTSKVGIDEANGHAVFHTLQQIYQFKNIDNEVDYRFHLYQFINNKFLLYRYTYESFFCLNYFQLNMVKGLASIRSQTKRKKTIILCGLLYSYD